MARQGRNTAEVIDRDELRREKSSSEDFRGATIERIRKTDGHFVVGDDKQGGKTWTMMDSPLERLHAQGKLTKHEYDGLVKFRIHWYHGGLQPSLSSVDPNRVFAADPSNFSGMAKSERQVFHRQQYREVLEMLGHRARIVLENVVCTEQTVLTAGYALGWKNRPQAEAAAIESLRDSGWRLAKHWGMV
ncbi:hypothetical protein [Afipia clevelandensis]|uniref:Uncharacterized protein n=1 Tax=Afipia clevelandensis ATCC 49720 TaxID=883079 RepID=K8P8F2_9BRAD|nr:hypothetical protein [Afipia clevelandensis]EKS37771.1 hypothetical protein HMPREF9696_01721 [Afipia clevelandensis ATCC 49720]